MTYLLSFTIIMIFLLIGEWVSAATKAFVPSIFITAVLFTIGYWTILPKNVVLILLGILGMFIASFILAKPFGMSREMAFACSIWFPSRFYFDYRSLPHDCTKPR